MVERGKEITLIYTLVKQKLTLFATLLDSLDSGWTIGGLYQWSVLNDEIIISSNNNYTKILRHEMMAEWQVAMNNINE